MKKKLNNTDPLSFKNPYVACKLKTKIVTGCNQILSLNRLQNLKWGKSYSTWMNRAKSPVQQHKQLLIASLSYAYLVYSFYNNVAPNLFSSLIFTSQFLQSALKWCHIIVLEINNSTSWKIKPILHSPVNTLISKYQANIRKLFSHAQIN